MTLIPDKTPTAKTCPKCGPVVRLIVRTNTKTNEQFLGCENWPECFYTEPLSEDLKMELLGASRLPGF
jgi:ssDNA-binding Zn-finger/Zn-ribbon topoisomerase 1